MRAGSDSSILIGGTRLYSTRDVQQLSRTNTQVDPTRHSYSPADEAPHEPVRVTGGRLRALS